MDSMPCPANSPEPVSDARMNQQKRELVVLNSIFQIIASSSKLSDTLEKVLDFVLSMVNSSVGWVCLHDQDGVCASFTGYKGLCFSTHSGSGPTPCLAHCVCDRVRQTKEVVMINSLAKGCPLLLVEGEPDRQIVGHVSIPLTTKSRLVGQLNVAFDSDKQIHPDDLELLKAIGPQLAVAIENARLWDEIQNKERMLKKLLNNVVSAQEEERRRISRELHDEMGQNLTSLLIGLRVLENTEACCMKEELIGGMSKTVSEMISSIHDLALELRPPTLDDLGLVPALVRYIQDCPERLGISVDHEVLGTNGRHLSHEAEIAAYRMVQEALTNVARHSHASKASVILNQGGPSLSIIIEDNGDGFDLKEFKGKKGQTKRLGLFGMQERAALVGGSVTVESSPGAGTSVYIEIPWEASPND